jgi:NarL family two-component system response regulator LiaR
VTAPIRVLIVDDHVVVRRGLRTFLSVHDDLEIVGEAGNGREALDQIERTEPDVVLMDLRMPELDGPSTIGRLSAEHPEIQVIALTSFADGSLVRRAIDAGATSYLLKEADETEIVSAIRLAHAGRSVLSPAAMEVLLEEPEAASARLTAREHETLILLAKGLTNPQIADRLGTSLSTANFHVRNILTKLGAKTRTEAVVLARNEGLLAD